MTDPIFPTVNLCFFLVLVGGIKSTHDPLPVYLALATSFVILLLVGLSN